MCVQQNWLVLLVGAAAVGKSAVLQLLSQLTYRKLHTVALSPQMDVGELLGGFEQVSFSSLKLDTFLNVFRRIIKLFLINGMPIPFGH